MSTSPVSRPRKRGLPPAPRLPATPPVVASDDPPFLRSQVRARPRRKGRGIAGRLAFQLQLATAVVALVIFGWAGLSRLLASERLHVGHIKVRGNRFLSEGEVRELLSLTGRESLLSLDMEQLKTRLRASPWLEDATVRRTLPDTLSVEVAERQPLALAEAERLYLMDAEGDLIDLYGSRTGSYDLPILRGLGGLDATARRARAERAATLLQELGSLEAELSEISVDAEGDLRVVLREDGLVLRFGAPPYRPSFETFLRLRRELSARCPRAEYFDLRFKDRIFAKEPPPEPAPAVKSAAVQEAPPTAPALPEAPAVRADVGH